MKKNRLVIVVYILLIAMLALPTSIKDSKADIVMTYGTGVGNFLPEENSTLIMTNASVIFTIGAKNYLSRIYINFIGNYTVYNPNKSMNATLAAPFSSSFTNLESSCEIKIDNTTISYDFIDYNFTESPWEEYLDWQYAHNRKFLIINATFPENDSLTIEYSFSAYIDTKYMDILKIYYDVGTSRAWNGTISERVEFEVYGQTPDYYSPSRNCTISDITNGKSYVWEWENEIIDINSVSISYSYYNPYARLIFIIIFLSMFAVVIISVVLINRRFKRKARRELRHSN